MYSVRWGYTEIETGFVHWGCTEIETGFSVRWGYTEIETRFTGGILKSKQDLLGAY